MKFSKLYPANIVKSNGVYGFRKYQKEKYVDFSNLDVFFDFKTVGNIPAGTPFTLENQGSNPNVTFTTVHPNGVNIVEGEGAKLFESGWYTGTLDLCGVNTVLANGPKTIAFKMTEAQVIPGVDANILSTTDYSKNAFLGIGRNTSNKPYFAYARATATGKNFNASAVDKDYSIDGTHFAWMGGNKDYRGRNIILTVGSSESPSLPKLYIDGVLVAIFDIAGGTEPIGYMNLSQSDEKIRCFGVHHSIGTVLTFQSATISYFAMTQGEMNATQVAELNEKLNAIA